ncbi:MAG: recombinase family protein [Clostridiales bacterium]|nr:recombinase family protein [Clostridiales bacterium]
MTTGGSLAAIYCRLSKEDAEKLRAGDDSESIQNQKMMLTEYALRQNFIVYKVYSDDDYSGFSDRPQFNQMLKDAENGLFNIVLCKHQARFTRDMELVERYIHGLFVLWGIRFISLVDHVDTFVRGGKKARQINGLINEWYCEDLSENVKAVLSAKRAQGQFVGAYTCYGYIKDPDDKHKLIVDAEAARVVKDIFHMYLSGMGVNAIAAKLTGLRIPTPAQHKAALGIRYQNANAGQFSKFYGAWAVNTVRKILRNETYIGSLVQGRQRSVSYKTKKLSAVPKDEWVIVPDAHEPVIDRRTFETAQRLMDKKRTLFYDESALSVRAPHLLAGKVVCLDCGSTLFRSGASRNGSDRYLRCLLAAKTKGQRCSSHYVSENKLQGYIAIRIKAFIDAYLAVETHGDISGSVVEALSATGVSADIKKKQLCEIDVALKKIQRNTAMAYSDKLSGVITGEDFLMYKSIFDEEKESLLQRQGQLINEINNNEREDSVHDAVETMIKTGRGIDLLTHEVINDFIVSVQVGEKNRSTGEQVVVINWNI